MAWEKRLVFDDVIYFVKLSLESCSAVETRNRLCVHGRTDCISCIKCWTIPRGRELVIMN